MNPGFSNLIYRIIGKPERWHDDYLEIMHQVIDDTDSFDEPENFSELEIGDQMLSRLKSSNATLAAFSSLIDESRFKMVILDEQLNIVCHNQIAENLLSHIISPADKSKLSVSLINAIKAAPQLSSSDPQNNIHALNFTDHNNDQVYLRRIQNRNGSDNSPASFHLIMVLDHSRDQLSLNSELIEKFELTQKEQAVLIHLMHGKTIKKISEESFISENTVKTHLKSIFRKTNTKSQADVIRLILTHESRILESYFDTGSNLIPNFTNERDLVVKLKDGHLISYRDYGPKDGKPIIIFHNAFGCRVTIPNNYKEILQRTNRRVIIPDRPGTGKTPYIEDHPNNWNERLHEFIDQLQLDEYDILGSVVPCRLAISFATSCDHKLGKVILTCPVFLNSRKQAKHLTGILSPAYKLSVTSMRVTLEIYELWLKSITLNLDKHYLEMVESSIGSKERELFKTNNTFDLIVDSFKEATTNTIQGISNELVHSLSPANIDLSSFNTPVEIWYGTEDKRITLKGAEETAKLFNNCTLNVREGYSEHIYYALFEEIIS